MARNACTFKILYVAGDYGQMIDTGCRGYEVVGPTISCAGANAAPFNGNFSGYWQDVLSKKQIAALEEMDISYSEIANLKGLEHFTALKELVCWSNNLSTIDVSKNPTLEILRCNGNELSALDLSKNKALKVLACDQNKLKTLDLSSLPDLRALACRYNELTALDLSHNAALTELDCWGNELTALDLSKNVLLTKLNCLENPIKTLDLSKNLSLSEATLPETATITLPGGDKILMADFKVVKASDGKNRLDLSKYGYKIKDIILGIKKIFHELSHCHTHDFC